MTAAWIPPFFRGDGMSLNAALGPVSVGEFGEFSVVYASDSYSRLRIDGAGYHLAKLFFVVRPSLRVYAMREYERLWTSQEQGRPVLRWHKGEYETPLLAFGGFADGKWFRFVFTKEQNSLSGYGWVVEQTKENPLTPEWASVILSHGQEIANA
jgi:hypothetical protein